MSTSLQLVEPTHISVPDFHTTLGPEVGDLATLAGFAPDPEQQLVLDAMFAVDRRGRSTAFEVAVIACRQNLKTGVFKQAALGYLFLSDERLVVWSAHEFRTAQEAFRDLEQLVTGYDVMRRRVKAIHRGNGDEAIELTTGARIIFKTRTKGGGRGLSGRKVFLDEGFALQPMHIGALLPTLSAQPDPQVAYGSSAALADSQVLRDLRDRGRAGDPRLAYFEWCAPDPAEACDLGKQCDHALSTPGCGCDKPELWQQANPQMGRRISVDYIAAERRALTPGEFGRERMGWHDLPAAESVEAALNLARWNDLENPASRITQGQSFGVDIAPDRTQAAIGAAGLGLVSLVKGHPQPVHVELVDYESGTDWLVARCVQLNERHGPAVFGVDVTFSESLAVDLERAGLTVARAKADDLATACAGMVDSLRDAALAHGPQPELTAAVKAARRRTRGDGGYVFGRKASETDISPLWAVTLARWVATGHADDMSPVNNVW